MTTISQFVSSNLPQDFPCGSAGKKKFACDAGDLGSIPGLGRYPGEGKGYPFQYSVIENSMDHIGHGVAKSWTRLSNFHFQPEYTWIAIFLLIVFPVNS